MLLERKNLVNELLRERKRTRKEKELLEEVQTILAADETKRKEIKERLTTEDSADRNPFIFELLETNRIFHVSQIRKICIDYRLRFLDSHYYKHEIPEEAVTKVKQLEKEHYLVLNGFKIVAPSKKFRLKNYDDPLLFAPIGNDYYYLIHKWGNDISPLRKAIVSPMRNFGTLLLFLAMASLLFTIVITDVFFTGEKTGQFELICFLFTFKGFCGIALYYCFWKGKNFNSAIWNSEFYNK